MTTKKTAETTAATTLRKTKHFQHEYDPSETNWTLLSLPSDTTVLTSKLRSEFRHVINRCHGSEEKFQQVRDNLEILLAWAVAKVEDDKQTNERNAEVAAARAAEAARREEFRARIQAGPTIRVTATTTGFIELNQHDGSVLAMYDTADDEQGPIASMARMMIAEGRDPNSRLNIDAFGHPAIGSGRTLAELAGVSISGDDMAQRTSGGLQAIRV